MLETKLSCNNKVILLSREKQDQYLDLLLKRVIECNPGNDIHKLNIEYIAFCEDINCLIKNNCTFQEYIRGKCICFHQEDLEILYELNSD